MNHKERILAIFKGEMVDVIPWVPRIDLWYNAKVHEGTLPKQHRERTVEEIHRAEGWPLHKMIAEFMKYEDPSDILHRGLGLYNLKEFPYSFELPKDLQIDVKIEENAEELLTHVLYHTPVGSIRVCHGMTRQMKKSGVSIPWIKEHAIKEAKDYKTLAYIYGGTKLRPAYERYNKWRDFVGNDGVAVAQGLGNASSSPMHFIQKVLSDPTLFYLHMRDYSKEMAELVEALEGLYDQLIPIIAESGADAVMWAANVDDTITYRTYFKEHILPWCQKAAQSLSSKGIFLVMHTDGENKNLLDLIPMCNMDVADAVTPNPMTKVKIEEYYDRWCRSNRLTIHGGIPQMLLLEESASWEELKVYMDDLFKVIVPGTRFVASIGDTTPPNAEFDRLLYIGERIQKEGRLPISGGAFRPINLANIEMALQTTSTDQEETQQRNIYVEIEQDVLLGDEKKIVADVKRFIDAGHKATDILENGMLSAMELISGRFADGTVYIPEVLLSARAMNEALIILEPYLKLASFKARGTVMIGTVFGDLHDIGKNIVITMLKGAGYDTVDLGMNVKAEKFVSQIKKHKPNILGLSALLTTTMPQMKNVLQAVENAGLRKEVKIIVGGAPLNQKFADSIGADGYAEDGVDAIHLVKRLISKIE